MSAFSRNYGMCILFIIIGAVLGEILGELMKGMDIFSGLVPYLVTSYPVLDIAPSAINLYVIRITIGLSFAPNIMSIIGVVLALILFRRY